MMGRRERALNSLPIEVPIPDRCDDCGEPVPIGAWPFCPHGKGSAYAFKMGFKMATQGWTRREK